MSASNPFGYDGKRVVVVGGATGMGAATARLVAGLGADVTVYDVVEATIPSVRWLPIDLRDRASVDAAADAIEGTIDVLFMCAGVPDGIAGMPEINFVSHRQLIERLVARGTLARGSAVAAISSVGGIGWERDIDLVSELLATPDWDSALEWIGSHEGAATYRFLKKAMSAYVAAQALPLLAKGIRINCIAPGPTDTPFNQSPSGNFMGFSADYRAAARVEPLAPEDMAGPLAFLGTDAASAVAGITLYVDQGHVAAIVTGAFDAPALRERFNPR